MPVKVFINYRRGPNLREAQHLATLLSAAFGKASVFLDLRGLGGAENWLERLQGQVDACDAMVCLIGKGWSDVKDEDGRRRLDDANDPLVHEIGRALVKRMPVLPLLIDGASMPDISSLPKSLWVLTLQHAMPLRNESFARDADDIIETLKRRLHEQRKGGMPAWALGTAGAALVATSAMSGPWLVSQAGLPFLGVEVVTRQHVDALRSEAVETQTKLSSANTALRSVADERRAAVEAAVAKERQAADQRLNAAVSKAREEAPKAAQEAARSADARRTKELAEQKAQHEAALTKERQAAASAIAAAVAKEKQETEQRFAKTISEHQAAQARFEGELATQRAQLDALKPRESQSALQPKGVVPRKNQTFPAQNVVAMELAVRPATPPGQFLSDNECKRLTVSIGKPHVPMPLIEQFGTASGSNAKLDEVANVLQQCPLAKAILWGHSTNKDLSGDKYAMDRALAARRYLESKGVPRQNIVVHGRDRALLPYRLATDVSVELTISDEAPSANAPNQAPRPPVDANKK